MSPRDSARASFRARAKAAFATRLTCGHGRTILAVMKSAAILFCLIFALAKTAAQDVITPTNHVELFNGRDFSGWIFFMMDNADPLKTWSVTNGVIHCSGAAIGYLRTKQNFQNYTLTVEWRFVKVAPKADNTGVPVHMQLPDKVWPPCIQNQGKSGRQGDLIFMSGTESKEHKRSEERRVG